MYKDELIKLLEEIEGNPRVFIEYNKPDGYFGYEKMKDEAQCVKIEGDDIVIGDLK